MIESYIDSGTQTTTLTLKPNRSWNWRANLFLLLSLTTISSSVALMFTLQGYFLILPFAVIEMSVLFACLYYCVHRTHRQQVLQLSNVEVAFADGNYKPRDQLVSERLFAKFMVTVSPRRCRSKTITMICQPRPPTGQPVVEHRREIGSFLSNAEKDQLIGLLRTIIHQFDTGLNR